MNIPILSDLVIVFALAVPVIFLCHKLRIPTIVGFLFTGIAAGPYGAGFIHAAHEVEVLAEIGVVLLLFTIGLEFSLRSLVKIKRAVLLGGLLQVGLTLLAGLAVARAAGRPIGQAVFLGFLLSLSSTAIVLKLLQERSEIESPHGRICLAVLIFQDVVIVPMMLAVPLLAGSGEGEPLTALWQLAKALGLVVLVLAGAWWLVPRILFHVARTRSRELFLLTVIVICFATSWLTSTLGLSLALGAFLAGLIISESDYSHQALGNILPLRDLFASLFFVSVGMLLDTGFLMRNLPLVLLVTAGVFALKSILASTAAFALGYPLRTAVAAGLGLSQIGEFSFVLSKAGMDHGLLDAPTYQLFIAVSVLTMAVTPFVIPWSRRAAGLFARLPWPARVKSGLYGGGGKGGGEPPRRRDHVIIAGYGVGGRHVARAASASGIPYVIVEMNPETVSAEKKKGEPIMFGDAAEEPVLEHAGIREARVLVAVISDPLAVRRVTELAKKLNPAVHVVARTRYFDEIGGLRSLGADEVVTEEFEASIEIFALVLMKYLLPRDEIDRFVAEARAGGYDMLRSPAPMKTSLADLGIHLSEFEIQAFRVCEGSPLAGRTPAELDLRNAYDATLLAVRRGPRIIEHPDAHTILLAGDVLVILGRPEKLASAACLFDPGGGDGASGAVNER